MCTSQNQLLFFSLSFFLLFIHLYLCHYSLLIVLVHHFRILLLLKNYYVDCDHLSFWKLFDEQNLQGLYLQLINNHRLTNPYKIPLNQIAHRRSNESRKQLIKRHKNIPSLLEEILPFASHVHL